ncbi:MAG: SusC/RagA family TonB-linked outer membrane protein, partial [Candidatus Cryptobacteroides sp.]
DASAAIYGVRAADGVILITTKQGKMGKPSVTYDGSYSFVRNYPYLEVLDAREFMIFSNIMNKETYLYNNSMYPYGSSTYDGGWTPRFTEEEIKNAETTDWTKFVLKNGYIHNHNLSVSGGTQYVKYYLSGQYFGQDGTVVNSGMTKLTLHANISASVFKFWNITASMNVNRNKYLNANTGADTGNRGSAGASALYASLIIPPYLPEKQEDGSYTIFSNIPNPSSMRDISDNTTENGYNFNVSTTFNLWKDYLKLKGIYGMNQENSLRNTYIPSTVYFDLVMKSRGNVSSQTRRYQTAEVMLSFSKDIAGVVNLDALLGMGLYKQDYYGYSVDYEDTIDVIREDDIASATGNVFPGSYRGENEHRSQFLKASADILDRYVVAFTLRRDGSDKFFDNQKYNLFPSVSFAWKISNEKFLSNVSWLNLLKFRGSWGITGSDSLGSTLYGTYSATDFRASFDGNTTQYIPYVLNSENSWWVSWQKTHMKNIGLDFYVLGNRLYGSFDFFRNDVTRLLGTDASAPLAMFETRKVNYGHYYRQGWELNLNSVNFNGEFRWETSLAVSHVNSIWVKRQDNYAYQEYQIREKEPVNAWYYYKVTGIVNTDRSNVPDSQYTISSSATMPGVPIIDDKNGDGKITVEDVYMKNNVPAAYIGFGNTFSWKNFSLDIYCYGQFGLYKSNVVLNTTSPAWLSEGSKNSSVLAYKIWNSQTNPEGTRPGVASSNLGTLPGNCGTDINMEDASFMKIRNVTFSYTFDEKILGVVGKYVKSICLYFDTQNPLTFTRYTGFDPEMYMGGSGEGGKSVGEYPATRTFSLGARISF